MRVGLKRYVLWNCKTSKNCINSIDYICTSIWDAKYIMQRIISVYRVLLQINFILKINLHSGLIENIIYILSENYRINYILEFNLHSISISSKLGLREPKTIDQPEIKAKFSISCS